MTGPSRYQAVLFDLDGTLLDTLADLADSGNTVLRGLGFPEHSYETYKVLVGEGIESLVRRALPAEHRDPATVAQCLALMRQEYGQHWADKTRPYAGIEELLDALSARGIRTAVFSNKPHEFTQLCVSRFLPRGDFAVVLGQQSNRAKKPDPAGALEIAAQLGLPPAAFLYLGDTNTDMQTATAAGMFPVGVTWGFRTVEELQTNGARALIDGPLELLRLLPDSSGSE